MTREEAKEVFINRGYVNIKGGTIFDGDKWRQSVEVITEWLKEQPCGDAISRQAVIDSLHSKFADGFDSDRWWNSMSVLYAINKVPSVSTEKTGRWIPVSERLPEIHQDVLLSLRSLDIEVGFRAETEPYFYCHGADGCYIEPQNVIAWMPLPQPYKGESEG